MRDERKIQKKKRRNERVERKETWDITNSFKSLECLEKGASIVEKGRINPTNLQTQNKNK